MATLALRDKGFILTLQSWRPEIRNAFNRAGAAARQNRAFPKSSRLSRDDPLRSCFLRNAMERAAVLVRRPVVTAADLDFLNTSGALPDTDWLAGTLPEAVARLEAEIIRQALVSAGGNRARAAERLGIRRQLLYDKIARYELDESPKRTNGVSKEDRRD